MATLRSIVVGIGVAYVVGIGVLYVSEEGYLTAYLTMPAWLLVGGLSYLLAMVAPDSALDVTLFTRTGNFVLLLVSAALNVAGLYFIVRRLSKA